MAEEITAHDQAMVDAVDKAEENSAALVDPTLAPEYKAPEVAIDYEVEYKKLKAEIDEKPEPVKPPDSIPSDVADGDVLTDFPEVTPEVLDTFTEEFNTNGALSEASYKALADKGYSQTLVDNYIQGQVAVQEALTAQVITAAGGQEAYSNMLEWAQEAWTPEQIEVFNSQVSSGDKATVDFGVNALKLQYKAEGGLPTRKLNGSTPQGSGNSLGFESKTEMMEAMQNRAYGKDPAYTQMVAAKVGNSNF